MHRTDLKNESEAMNFHDGDAYTHFGGGVNPQKQALYQNFLTKKFWRQKNVPSKKVEGRKIKCWESPETDAGKFSSQTEPSSGGKQPEKVLHFFGFFVVSVFRRFRGLDAS